LAFYFGWKPYVPAAERRRQAAREAEKRLKQGHEVAPVRIESRAIASTFWGKSWCENLERYSDYANRLPRGRTYVRNGSVIDLKVKPGLIEALVSGSSLYEVRLEIEPVGKKRWKAICDDCGGAIDSLVELLQGKLSKGVMERICRRDHGLFPSPSEIRLSCSCPDWADMCKHVAAVLYGVGARLDDRPELLFQLRKVDEKDLILRAGKSLPIAAREPAKGRILDAGDLPDIFGIDMVGSSGLETPAKAKKTAKRKAAKRPAVKTKGGRPKKSR
jgi:uncharacterized Zn finger protein